VAYLPTSCPFFDNLEFDIFDAMEFGANLLSVLRAGRFPYIYWHRGVELLASFLISTFVRLALNLPMTSHLRSG